MSIDERLLAWANCYNVRDLGGLITSNGSTIQMQRIVRSDIPTRLTGENRQRLLDYGIRTILDLRRPEQVAEEPSLAVTELATPDAPRYINIPLEAHTVAVDRAIDAAGPDRVQSYRLLLEHNRPQVAKIMRSIAEAQSGGLLIHCSAGKDRTGLVVALLLSLAGVPDEVVADDYALSETALWPLYEELVAAAGGEEQVGWWLKPVAPPATMIATLNHIRARDGGVAAYLQSCGLSHAVLSSLQSRLLAPQT